MPTKRKSRRDADDAPLTAKELKTGRRLSECSPDIIRLIRKNFGRPIGRTKQPIHLSLDADLVKALRDSGKGWQTRTNALLRQALKLPPLAGKDVHV